MATLGNRARRLQSTVLQPLESVRSEIIYHLTALELQKEPWSNQVIRLSFYQSNSCKFTSTSLYIPGQSITASPQDHTVLSQQRRGKHIPSQDQSLQGPTQGTPYSEPWSIVVAAQWPPCLVSTFVPDLWGQSIAVLSTHDKSVERTLVCRTAMHAVVVGGHSAVAGTGDHLQTLELRSAVESHQQSSVSLKNLRYRALVLYLRNLFYLCRAPSDSLIISEQSHWATSRYVELLHIPS